MVGGIGTATSSLSPCSVFSRFKAECRVFRVLWPNGSPDAKKCAKSPLMRGKRGSSERANGEFSPRSAKLHFPLHQWKPADIARLFILMPVEHVPRRKGWGKRDQRLKASDKQAIIKSKAQYKPSNADMLALTRATKDEMWKAYFEDEMVEFPRIGILHGPLMANGLFYTPERISHPLGATRQRDPFQGLYSRREHDEDVLRLEYTRTVARENFYLGQTGEGPYVDGLVYARIDNLLLAEIAYCDARLRFTSFILQAKRKERTKAAKQEIWNPIGSDEAVAKTFEHSGFKVRKIETTSKRWYEVLQQ